ncbi:hypothetical protein BDW75DRAFT_220364 [Aspergillus navahoensis]
MPHPMPGTLPIARSGMTRSLIAAPRARCVSSRCIPTDPLPMNQHPGQSPGPDTQKLQQHQLRGNQVSHYSKHVGSSLVHTLTCLLFVGVYSSPASLSAGHNESLKQSDVARCEKAHMPLRPRPELTGYRSKLQIECP